MKKLFALALAAASVCAVDAADFTAYQNGTLASDVAANTWWNIVMDLNAANPDGEGSVWSLTYNPNEPGGGASGPNFCAGLQAKSETLVAGQVAKATLNFKYYATTTCKINVQVGCDGTNQTQVIMVSDADINKWNTASFVMNEAFPEASKAMDEYKADGVADILGLVVEQFNADTKLYVNDVVFTGINEEWTKPEVEKPFCPEPVVPAVAAEDVVSVLSGAYTAATGFGIGGWGQSTKAKLLTSDNGAPVYMLTDFNYLGWELQQHINVEGYDYMHVDFWPVTETAFGFTPISPEKEKPYIASEVKVGEWNHYDVELSHWDNVVFSDLFQIKFDQGNTGATCYIANVYFWKDTRVIPVISASASDITMDGANLSYEVTLPAELEGADVKVFLDGTTELTASPYALTGLTPSTEYSYTLKAVATLAGETYESDPVTVTFKTLRDASEEICYYQIVNGRLTNAYKMGENSSMAREIPVSSKVELVYNADKTITANFSVMGETEVVGFTYEINIGGEYSGHLNGKAVDGVYTYTTTKTFEEGENIHTFMWFGYAGGINGIDLKDFKAGESSEPVAYGVPAGVVLETKTTEVVAEAATPVVCYAYDADGNYLLNEAVALSVKEGEATVSGDFVTLPGRGTAVIEAACGEFTAQLTFECITSAGATNVAKGIVGVASEFATNDPALATDDNENTQLEFSCASTQEHSLALDLGKNYDIEVIEIVFEGASATQYSITVERETPDTELAAVKAQSKVYEVTDGQGGAGVTARKEFVESTPIVGRYVTLNTTKAFEPGWGIKLKELRVIAKESTTPSGIDAVEAESDAPARYFRLDGVEVSGNGLPAGIYVKLQGKTATKVFVR